MSEIQETIKPEQGKIVVYRSQDVSAYLDRNKREQAAFQRRRNAPLRKVAEIPLIVVEQWRKQGIDIFNPDHNKKIQGMLNSNEYQYLRTSPGKMAMKG